MKLHFLGTTGYHPNNRRQTACLMLPEIGVVFDAGTGFFRVRDLLQTPTLDIFLTHLHLDHSVGLTFLYDVLFEKELERVTVHVAEEKMDSLLNHLYAELMFPVEPNFELRPLQMQGTTELTGGGQLAAIPLEHPGGSHGFRVDWRSKRRSFAYITDTIADPDADYVPQIKGVQTLVHECNFPDGWEDKARLTGHSCLTPVAKVARAAKVGCCYLVHVNPLDETDSPLDLESVKPIYERISVAADHQVIDI